MESISRPSALNRTVTIQLLRNEFLVIPASHCCAPLEQRSARLRCHQRMTAMIFDKRKVSPLDIDFVADRSRLTRLRRSPNVAPRPICRPQSGSFLLNGKLHQSCIEMTMNFVCAAPSSVKYRLSNDARRIRSAQGGFSFRERGTAVYPSARTFDCGCRCRDRCHSLEAHSVLLIRKDHPWDTNSWLRKFSINLPMPSSTRTDRAKLSDGTVLRPVCLASPRRRHLA